MYQAHSQLQSQYFVRVSIGVRLKIMFSLILRGGEFRISVRVISESDEFEGESG